MFAVDKGLNGGWLCSSPSYFCSLSNITFVHTRAGSAHVRIQKVLPDAAKLLS